MTMRSTDYALLSQASYKDPVIESRGPEGTTYKDIKLDGVSYRPLDHMDDPKTGFQATAYQNKATGEVIIAYRGTEFDREAKQDGMADAAMTFKGTNGQAAESMAFTKRVIDAAKQNAELTHQPLNVTVTGHSLGGTLAEINAYKFHLHGETFNSFGAAGLSMGIPAGGNQVIDHVRATDVVSSASPHFGEVRVYAVPQDTQALSQAGYSDSRVVNALTHPAPVLGKIQLDAHAIDNFVPNSTLLGSTIISPANEKYAEAHHTMIEPYRNNIEFARDVAHVEYEIDKPVLDATGAVVHRVENNIKQTGELLGAIKDKAVEDYHGTVNAASHGIEDVVGYAHKAYPVLLNHPAHPDYMLFNQSLGAVHRLDAELGRTPDQHSTNLAAGVAVGAKAHGLSRVDHVLLSTDGANAFAVQGDPASRSREVARPIPTEQAVRTPVEQHTQAMQQVNHQQQQVQQQVQQAMQVQQPQQQGPTMGR
jgi:hypothetical protein